MFLNTFVISGCVGSLWLCELFSSCGEWRPLCCCHGLIAVASLTVEHGLWGPRTSGAAAHGLVLVALRPYGLSSAVVLHVLRCSTARGIRPDKGSNLCLLHWQMDSSLLNHQGSSSGGIFRIFYV